MPGFIPRSMPEEGWVAWTGDPDDDAAHLAVLGWLREAVDGRFPPVEVPLPRAIQGNLGEFIAYRIGRNHVFINVEIAHNANTSNPLNLQSKSDVDIVWLYFGANPLDDWAAIQEVKTTGAPPRRSALDLVSDYDKLFGENVRLTLQTRLTALKNTLDERGAGHLAPRVTALGGPAPNQSRGVRLVPTIAHDAVFDASIDLVFVRQSLVGRGWDAGVIQCWSISLGDIDDRLSRLARGAP